MAISRWNQSASPPHSFVLKRDEKMMPTFRKRTTRRISLRFAHSVTTKSKSVHWSHCLEEVHYFEPGSIVSRFSATERKINAAAVREEKGHVSRNNSSQTRTRGVQNDSGLASSMPTRKCDIMLKTWLDERLRDQIEEWV